MQLYWHRRNLQPRPNPGLATAFSAAKRDDSRVLAMFVLDESILSRANGLGTAFMLGSLRSLRGWYREHDSDLVIQYGTSAAVVSDIANTLGADRVVWNTDHSQLADGRDRAVRRALDRGGVAYTSVPHGSSTAANRAPAPVEEPEAYLASPETVGVETTAVPRLSDIDEYGDESAPLVAGSESARKRLNALSNGTTYRQCDDIAAFETGLEWLRVACLPAVGRTPWRLYNSA